MVHSWNTAGSDSVYACRAIVVVHTQTINGYSIPFLYGATVSLGDGIFAGLIYESNTGGLDTLEFGLPDCIWPEEPLYFYGSESGVIGDTMWSDEVVHPTNGGVSTATLQVTVSTTDAE